MPVRIVALFALLAVGALLGVGALDGFVSEAPAGQQQPALRYYDPLPR